MKEQEYYRKLATLKASRINEITYAVNCKVPEKEIGLKDEVEKMYYDRLMKQAKEHEKKYGKWPVFAMQEIESDDPKLDIYND